MNNESNNNISTYLGPNFQQKLIWQLLVEPEFAKNVLPNIAVEYFDDPHIKRLFIIMLEYYNEHEKVPNLQNGSIDDAIYKYKSPTNEVEGDVLTNKVDQIRSWNERIINKNQLYDGEVVRNDTINFIKQQEYRKLAEYIFKKIKTGEIKTTAFNFEVEEKINKIFHIGDDEDYGTDVIDNIEDALSEEFRQTIPTGIEAIDAVTGNGLGKGEIGLVLAPSGIGKTTILTKIANSAVNTGNKVLQIIFEDTVKQVQRKHFAIWSNIKLSQFDDNKEIIRERSLKEYNKAKEKGGKVDIVRFSQEDTTIYEIKNWIARQEKKFGYKYDVIVLDYLDCVEPNKKEKELLSAELSVIKSFEALAADYDIPCWSAIQTNRTGFNVQFVEAENTGGNIKRVQKSHFVMSIAKPEKSDNSNLANIKVLKARFAHDGHEFKDCIFNNDSLEIRVTDKKYLKGLDVKKYDDSDLNKSNEKAKNLAEAQYHEKISESTYNDSQTVGEIKSNLSLNDGVLDNKSISSGTTSNKLGEDDEKVEVPNNANTVENFNNESENSEEKSKKESDINPDEFFNQCASESNENNNQLDFLKKKRDEQGDIQKK